MVKNFLVMRYGGKNLRADAIKEVQVLIKKKRPS
jgi:hypothetical protein